MSGVLVSASVSIFGTVVGSLLLYHGAKKAKERAPTNSEMQSKCVFVVVSLMIACTAYGIVGAIVIKKALEGELSFRPTNAGLASGLVIGFSSAFSTAGLGVFGSQAVQSIFQQTRLFVCFVLVAIFIEAFALYGFIVGIVTVKRANLVDLAAGVVVPFASMDVLANLGGVVSTVAVGVTIMRVGADQTSMQMKCMFPVVCNGVIGIYGLMSAIVEAYRWPPTGEHACVVGVLYILSSVGLTYVGCSGVRRVAEDSRQMKAMVMKLIECLSIALTGLIFGVYMATCSNSRGQTQNSSIGPVATELPATPATDLAVHLHNSLSAATIAFAFAFVLIVTSSLGATLLSPRWRQALQTPLLL
jgi:F0F1-type ATP synthase membrane subunit c/vacuolar-type H+-ATPase subunit K